MEESIAKLDERIDVQLEPYREHLTRLRQIPGVDRVGAVVIIAELGVNRRVLLAHLLDHLEYLERLVETLDRTCSP